MTNEKLKSAFFRFLFTVLLSAGFLLPVLGVSGFLSYAGKGIAVLVIAALILSAAGISRTSAVFAAVLLPVGAAVWLLAFGGLDKVIETARAFTLAFGGIDYALPLVSENAVLILSVLIALVSFPMVLKKTGSWLSLMACTAVALLLWLKNVPEYTVYLLPALTASFTIMIRDRHEELSLLRLFPFVVLIVAAAYLLTPSEGIVSAKMKSFADDLRQTVMDRMFYTEPRDVFSLSSEGYYPQGSGQLGGPVDPSDRPVMQVSAPRDVYLRGIILDQYNGRCWKNTAGGRRYLWDSRSGRQQRAVLFNQDLPSASLSGQLSTSSTVSVRMLSDKASTLFVPQRIINLIPGGDLTAYYSSSSEIFSTRNLQAGDTWSVEALLFTAGDPGIDTLILSASDSEDGQWNSILDKYTALPDHLEKPVMDLASSITSGLVYPYEKAFAIQSWLSRNCRYNQDVEPQPADMDFVTNFLMNTKEGYCTYFASAMTVLCRLAGLPSRYIEGYLAEPGETGEALVTGQNAHAWTEVYFKGFGWLTFDATPRRVSNKTASDTPAPTPAPSATPGPEATPEPENANISPEPTPYESGDTNISESDNSEDPESPDSPVTDSPEPEDSSSGRSGFRWWILVPLFLILIFIWRVIITSPDYLEKHSQSARERFNIRTEEITRLLRSAGITRRPGETPMSFTRRLDAEDRFNTSLSAFGECVSLCSYGNVEPIDSDIQLIRDTAVMLRKEIPLPSRIRCLLSRVFTSRKKPDLL